MGSVLPSRGLTEPTPHPDGREAGTVGVSRAEEEGVQGVQVLGAGDGHHRGEGERSSAHARAAPGGNPRGELHAEQGQRQACKDKFCCADLRIRYDMDAR